MDDQDRAYETAVLEARRDPAMAEVVRESFLGERTTDALESFRSDENWLRIAGLLERCGVPRAGRVLDLGGGRGLVAAALAREGYEAVLCEPNPSEVVGAGAARALAAQVEPTFAVRNVFVGELRSEAPFDAVVCRAVLHHIHPLEPVLSDVLAVLKPGGVFVASDEPTIRRPEDLEVVLEEHPFVRFGVEEWAGPASHYADALSEAGFEDVRDRFPVSYRGYREGIRSDLGAVLGTLGYLKYRVKTRLAPHPPEARAFTARRPAGDPAEV